MGKIDKGLGGPKIAPTPVPVSPTVIRTEAEIKQNIDAVRADLKLFQQFFHELLGLPEIAQITANFPSDLAKLMVHARKANPQIKEFNAKMKPIINEPIEEMLSDGMIKVESFVDHLSRFLKGRKFNCMGQAWIVVDSLVLDLQSANPIVQARRVDTKSIEDIPLFEVMKTIELEREKPKSQRPKIL